jgi:hypothetical protein
MEDVTILIQGKITQETYNFYVEAYPQYPIVISTWSNHQLDLSYFPNNLTIVQSHLPEKSGDQNMNSQFISTLNGLSNVKTKYVIKFRGDEYFSNINTISESIKSNPSKIWSAPIFFRHPLHFKYHISDHIIGGTIESLKFMYSAAKYAFDNELIFHVKDGVKHKYWEPEIHLTRSFLMAKYKTDLVNETPAEIMFENFDILKLDKLKPYKVIANIFKTHWYSDFSPHNNESIENINELFDEILPYNKWK